MRLSINDPKFEHGRWRVTVDGVDLTDVCREADSVEGYATVIIPRRDGSIRLVGDAVATVRCVGAIAIEYRGAVSG